jgi:hypothetical protein
LRRRVGRGKDFRVRFEAGDGVGSGLLDDDGAENIGLYCTLEVNLDLA